MPSSTTTPFQGKTLSIAVVNANLSPGGKCARLADTVAELLRTVGHVAEIHSLVTWDLPPCDGVECYRSEKTQQLTAALSQVSAIILISPIYNYDLNAAAKNLVELTGASWKGKAVGLVCVAGGEKSYLAPLGFLNSLAIDHRCLSTPRYVYVQGKDFASDGTLPTDGDIYRRLAFLAKEMPVLAAAAAEIAAMDRNKPI